MKTMTKAEAEKKIKWFEDFERKYRFVKAIDGATHGMIPSVQEIRYEFWYNEEKGWEQEYIIVVYRGGAIAPVNNNGNSVSATFRNIGKLLDGGYYGEVRFYENTCESADWAKVIFD